jgi:hypothetical protein
VFEMTTEQKVRALAVDGRRWSPWYAKNLTRLADAIDTLVERASRMRDGQRRAGLKPASASAGSPNGI